MYKRQALSMAASMGFVTKNYENYVGAVDFNEKEKALDILAHLDVCLLYTSNGNKLSRWSSRINEHRTNY